MNKYIIINSVCHGKIGEKIPFVNNPLDIDLHVGDLLVFEFNKEIYCRPIVKYNNHYGVYGFVVVNFKFDKIKKIAEYTALNEELLKSCHGDDYEYVSFEIVEAKKMTLVEIEKELGYKIELI